MKATDYSAAQILGAISAAITAHDMPAVADLMRMLAVVAPHEAEAIADAVKIAGLIQLGASAASLGGAGNAGD